MWTHIAEPGWAFPSLSAPWRATRSAPRSSSRSGRTTWGGTCGVCELRQVCRGCRARALARTGDLLGADDSCGHTPDPGAAVLPPRPLAFALGALALALRKPVRPQRSQAWLLALMGTFDAIALGLVTAAGSLPRAEYASVTSSLFGVLTVLLAAWFLRERVRAVQWLGIGAVFSGTALLGLQH